MAIVEQFSPTRVLFCAVGFLFAYFTYRRLSTEPSRRRLAKANGCKQVRKVPTIDPFLGLDVMYKNLKAYRQHRTLEWIDEWFKEDSVNTVAFSALGSQTIATIEPDNVKTVLSLDFSSWNLGEARKKAFAGFLGNGIFTSDGEAWHRSRQMLRPNFERSQIADLDLLERHVVQLVKLLPQDGSTVDLHDLFLRFTLDTSTEFLMGESVNSLAPRGSNTFDNDEFSRAFAYCANNIGNEDPSMVEMVWKLFGPDPQYKRYCKYIHEFVDGLIAKALSRRSSNSDASSHVTKSSRYMFLDELLHQTSDMVQIRFELLNVLLAGRDTTSALLTNVWFELSRRPQVYARLRSEIDGVTGRTPPNYSQLKDMKYLRALLNESLRLYPVVPVNTRQAGKDTVIPRGGGEGGHAPVLVRKGQFFAWSVHTMHRRRDVYGDDALEFKPERWLDGEGGDRGKALRPGWGYLPFNGGPRVCLGQQFALVEASYVTARLMQEISGLESRDPEPWREKLTSVCTNLGGCKVALTI